MWIYKAKLNTPSFSKLKFEINQTINRRLWASHEIEATSLLSLASTSLLGGTLGGLLALGGSLLGGGLLDGLLDGLLGGGLSLGSLGGSSYKRIIVRIGWEEINVSWNFKSLPACKPPIYSIWNHKSEASFSVKCAPHNYLPAAPEPWGCRGWGWLARGGATLSRQSGVDELWSDVLTLLGLNSGLSHLIFVF